MVGLVAEADLMVSQKEYPPRVDGVLFLRIYTTRAPLDLHSNLHRLIASQIFIR